MRSPLRATRVALLFAVLLAGPSCTPSRETVVLVTVGGLRADAVDARVMPTVAALGARHLAWTPSPHAAPGLIGVMTGRDPAALGNVDAECSRIPQGVPTLAERLAAQGTTCAAFVGDRAVGPLTGLGRGFAAWSGAGNAGAQEVTGEEIERLRASLADVLPASLVADRAALWIRQHADERRVFLWVHFGDPVEAVRQSAAEPRAAYENALREVDKATKLVLDALATYGRKDAQVVVAGVHGLALGAGGETLHGLFLTDEVVRVPVTGSVPGLDGADTLPALGHVLARAAGLKDADTPGPVLVISRLPARLYGWPEEVAVAGPEGLLAVRPAPAWRPASGTPVAGAGALGAAPAAYRARLAAAGVPDAPAAADAAVDLDALPAMARGSVALRGGDVAAARAAFADAVRRAPRGLAPRFALAHATAEPRGAKPDVDVPALLELAGADEGRRLDLARELTTLGAGADALTILRGIRADDAPTGLRIALARAFAGAGSLEEATRLLEPLAAAERAPELYELLGDLLAQGGNAFRAREAFEKAFAVPQGRTANLCAKLGDALLGLGDKDAALQRYAEALQLDPTYRYPHLRAADILLEKGQEGAAAHALIQSLVPSGDAVRDALARGRVLSRKGLLRAAAQELSAALQEHPGDDRLAAELARLYADSGQLAEARKMLDDALAKHPGSGLARVELARVHALAGESAAAIALLQAAQDAAGPGLAERVRTDPAFRKGGPTSPLAQAAAAFVARAAHGGESARTAR